MTAERSERNSDKRDTCHVGFVGFTLAMELLRIACCEPLDSETQRHIESLGVMICMPFGSLSIPANSCETPAVQISLTPQVRI
jgi:hypothetical protein